MQQVGKGSSSMSLAVLFMTFGKHSFQKVLQDEPLWTISDHRCACFGPCGALSKSTIFPDFLEIE
eukprot:6174413-Pleurochrysis_carterae.AAC.3